MTLKTKYEVGQIPHAEYPRPQLQRSSYLCLNGAWNFEKMPVDENDKKPSGSIVVPFSPESQNSGIGDGFVLGRGEKLVYERTVTTDETFVKDVVLLHFGAVDQSCEVFVNGTLVFCHRGGFTPFEVDVSTVWKVGENVVRVECVDETECSEGARGKQSSTPGQIWYTAQSGIWQSVWMESMPKGYVKKLLTAFDLETSTANISVDATGKKCVRLYDGETLLETKEGAGTEFVFTHPFTLWSPENPKLYDLVVTTESGDEVRSYFGFRTFGIGKDEKGKERLLLNGKPYFMNGVLDQGYWPDGLLTHPCDQAIVDELTALKAMGFNMVRKHIKIEPMRWYAHCDRLGLIVWQDFVSGGGVYNPFHVAIFPFLGFKHKDNDYAYFSRQKEGGREEFIESVHETVGALKNCTCIGVWVPFNEGWGQFDSAKITDLVRSLDDTRIIDSVSGWHDQGVKNTTLKSLHIYYTPLKVPKDPRPVVLSEFGGYSMQVEGHVFNPEKEFGYKKFRSQESLCDALEKLYLKKVQPLIKKGLSACVYTQVSDVEEEINGFWTYDRKVLKVPIDKMKKINDQIAREAEQVR